ncbi:MAG: hypothetical protein JWM28_2189 [Chitinophagaceae bacterium]|nr:hypothetical protein [Chitinophagaceae bacterium]
MKKQIFGFLAVVIALGASAFTAPRHAVKHQTAVYYWYKVNAANQIPSGSEAYSGDQVTPDDAETMLPCVSGTHLDCVRGFTNQITTFPSSAPGDTPALKKN